MGSRIWRELSSDSHGAQILELAVALPLVLVFVVGIYDFGQVFNTENELCSPGRCSLQYPADQ
jgi:Flp pilus assembly protein TadG